jgi:1-acyl-sn-glycerol-3-phosphate acyltransferase
MGQLDDTVQDVSVAQLPSESSDLRTFINTFLEKFYRGIARTVVHMSYNIETIGFDKLPDNGAFLLISNHVSFMDGLVINAVCKRHIRFIIDKPIYDIPFIRYFMEKDEAIPISSKKEIVQQALDEISRGLRKGDAICIFPEGQITYTGFMSHFRPGTEWMIRRDPVPVYPIYIYGLWGSVFSRKYLGSPLRFLPKSIFRRKITLMCGDAIDPQHVTIDDLQQAMLQLKCKLYKELGPHFNQEGR